jgi:3' terminal RNA ribose 2'-O-methyltransferase Hen1
VQTRPKRQIQMVTRPTLVLVASFHRKKKSTLTSRASPESPDLNLLSKLYSPCTAWSILRKLDLDSMLLTISTTHQPATDLGFLLHKNPSRVQVEELSFGKAHVFYPEAEQECCTAALLLEIDPVALVRGRGPAGEGGQLEQYVNDRPYAANSFLSVAMGRLFTTAMSGRSKERQELADTAIPLIANLPVVAARGGEDLVRRLFEPLGYRVELSTSKLDEQFPEWGKSPYVSLQIAGTVRLQDLLVHLYVLIPVLDNEKHYWVGDDEIEKLLKRGEGWLGQHLERDLIVSRYLKRQRHLQRESLARLLEESSEDFSLEASSGEEPQAERAPALHQQRMTAVLIALQNIGAKRVVDLGCGEGKLLRLLLAEKQFEMILGMDVSWRSLEIAKERLKLEHLPERQRSRIELIQGSLVYRDERLAGFDAAAVVEVIEHLDAPRLSSFERVLFEFARPKHAIITTPNAEYNTIFETLPAGQFRHGDHRFEWTRTQFQTWANDVAERFQYKVRFEAIGPNDDERGAPTQMAIFSQQEVAA